jgi:hypothetical protein
LRSLTLFLLKRPHISLEATLLKAQF